MKPRSPFVFRIAKPWLYLGLFLAASLDAGAGNRLANLASSSGSSSTSSGTAASQSATTATVATSQNLQSSALAQRAQASLSRSLQALQVQQAAQNAARASALSIPGSVPNGLVIGGLVPDSGLSRTGVANPVTTWVNANTPTQVTNNGRTTVTVTQTAQQALLNWQTFNIGQNTTLNFDQSAGGGNVAQWVAINKVAPNVAPSQILGSLTAQGQVYVINQNGIIFGGTSQINVGALVASSLPINDNLINRGLLNNPDDQFLFSQGNISAGSQGPTPAFTPASAPTHGMVAQMDAAGNLSLVPASGHDGDVTVQAGAQLTSPSNANSVAGKIALIGPNVANAGTISTPNGQTILAAGNQVGLNAHNSNDPTLRGLDVYVGAVDSQSGNALNSGLINSPEADITVTGKNVTQNGVITSSTSVSLNGRIDLLADYNSVVLSVNSGGNGTTLSIKPTASGAVTLGQGSLTQILPELSSSTTVVGSQLALSSIVDIQGLSISLGQNAFLWAPGATTPSNTTQPALAIGGLTLNSGVTLNAGTWLPYLTNYSFVNTTGQINLATGATIDVSGSQNVQASMSDNIVSAQLLGSELANFPLQQNGALRGKTIEFDLRQMGINADGSTWIGTPLADVSGYANLVAHTVGDLTTNGGSVSLNAGDSVNLQKGSTIDVSGGWINYQGGSVQTTKVISGGQIMDISQATANRVYQGIYTGFTQTSSKWGMSHTYGNPLITGAIDQSSYIQGGNAGSISITAPTLTLDGNLYGTSVAGPYQQTPASQLATSYTGASFLPTVLATKAIPDAATLAINFQAQNAAVAGYPTYSPTPPNIDFGTSQHAGDLVLSPDLINVDGFGHFVLNNGDGSIVVPAGVSLQALAGGSTTLAGGGISFIGANIDIEGNLSAPGGSLSFSVADYSPYADGSSPITGEDLLSTPAIDPTRGLFQLGSSASLNVAGLVVDNRYTASAPGSLPSLIKGGSITIKSFSANLAAGSTINVSGGATVSESSKISYGNGGSLTINAGEDPNIESLAGGHLVLGSKLEGYSGGKGGSLAIQAPLIQIGGVAGDPANTLLLSPDFFNQGGFANFSLTGLGEVAPNQPNSSDYLPAISIAAGTTINPTVQNWSGILDTTGVLLEPVTYSLASQRTPASLTFSAKGVPGFGGGEVVRGDFVLGANASIQTDPGGSVTISGNTADILGSIVTPGGKISISGGKNSSGYFADAEDPSDPRLVTVDLGSNSLLSTAGVFEKSFNAYGFNTGSVLSGGSIAVSGNLLAETGAVLDVSGATSLVDVSPTQAGATIHTLTPPEVATRVDSSAGSITLSGGEELVTNATLRGFAGGPSAQGGSLTISSQVYDPSFGTVAISPLDARLDISQAMPVYSTSGIGSTVVINGNPAGLGYFSADSFNTSGLDALALAGTVKFSGPVTINANRSLTVADSGIIEADAAVNLNAPYVKLGQAFQGPLTTTLQLAPIFTDSLNSAVTVSPLAGSGNLTVHASSLIDLGNLSLQNIGSLNLIAGKGDIRGDGTVDVAGNISLSAGQIYPTTDTVFTLAAYDQGGTPGSVTISSSGSRQLPLSAGGVLNVYASNIVQGGVLRAPIGSINLGSGVTSSSPTDPLSGQNFDPTQNLTLSAGSITSVSAVDPSTGQDLTIPYGTLLNGVSWIDPAGYDITVAGNGTNALPGKAVNVSGANINDQSGATIDLGGGGDLYAYRWVSGNSGTKDILSTTTSFAVIPGYSANYAPLDMTVDSSGANPYENTSLGVGSQVYLNASNGLPAGVYTLLPARYALLPGAFLVTPAATSSSGASYVGSLLTGSSSNGSSVNTFAQADGSSIVLGYRFNALDQTTASPSLFTSFEVASQSVVRSRAEYDNYSANTFLGQNAASHGISVRLASDAGKLVLAATQALTLQGKVLSQTPTGGLGSEVDITTPSNIVIAGPQTNLSSLGSSTLVLDSSSLSGFGADSLLIGGYRSQTAGGTAVTVTTGNLTVDNAGAKLSGPDIILASNQTLTLDPNSDVEQSGSLSSPAESLLFGSSGGTGAGNGSLVRVGSDSAAQISRNNVSGSGGVSLSIGPGSRIAGQSVILDSTSATALASSAKLSGNSIALDSGKISLALDQSQPSTGLVLSASALNQVLASAQALSLLSYSSIDIYGNGLIGSAADASGAYQIQSLSLHADEIRAFDGGSVTINAKNVTLDNSPGGVPLALSGNPLSGTLAIKAEKIELGGGSGTTALNIDGYANVNLNATGGVVIAATASNANDSSGNSIQGSSSLLTAGNVVIATPKIGAATAANFSLTANGALTINPVAVGSTATIASGLGATLNLTGASVTENSTIQLPSGKLSLNATGANGNLTIGGKLDVGGIAEPFSDLIKYTSGGEISLASNGGSVVLNPGSEISVAANSGGGNAGSLTVNAGSGIFGLNGGTILGQGGAGGLGGNFTLDAESLPSLDGLESALTSGGFSLSQSIRARNGDVALNNTAKTKAFNLSTDAGSITINGVIDASGETGGSISLNAYGNVTLSSGSLLTVAAHNFSDAGKGGSVTLAAGSETGGNYSTSAVVDIQSGSTIDLRVDANNNTSVAAGDFTGTLHIRAPQAAGGTDLQINPINGKIVDASSILIEGYKLYTPAGGSIDSVEGDPNSSTAYDGTVYGDAAGFAGNTTTILSRIFNPQTNPNSAAYQGIADVAPGAEIINTAGDLTLASDWDLSQFRFGPNNTAGVLTLRATGNLVFQGSLSDGFNGASYTATLLTQNTAVPINLQSWSYNLAAGSDLEAADFHQVVSTAEIYDPTTGLAVAGTNAGSLKLGNLITINNGNAGGLNSTTALDLNGYYQVIRTGTGNIDIATAGDVLLQNQFATIYTAGTQASTLANFVTPTLRIGNTRYYPAQYSLAGGNVTISAQGNIAHVTQNNQGSIVMDSEKELPNNWLYRRGYVDSATDATTGQFGASKYDSVASTSWWVDFSNFFEGIGALGGGDVTLSAGHDVSNVDAVAPTNARVTNQVTINGVVDKLAADQKIVELGGGDVTVLAGNDINGGVYYVERGQGTLAAGNSIITNSTRSPSLGTITSPASVDDSSTWLPTTLFLGNGSFDVTAQNNLLLGPVANPFLLPQGVANTYWDKTYFSTYASTDVVNVSALTGNVTLRESTTLSGGSQPTPLLQNWLQFVDLLSTNPASVSSYQPWLNITETSVAPFTTLSALLPSTILVTAYSGNINTVGNLTLSPSPTGEIDLLAAGSINGFQVNGTSGGIGGGTNATWSSTTINLSDADPNAIPGVFSPYAYEVVVGTNSAASVTTNGRIKGVAVSLDFSSINGLFAESGSTQGSYGVLQTKLKLHDSVNGQPLHANDPNPVHLYAENGDISGLTLFAGKAARVIAGQDITDIALYPQNVSASDISLVAAGRDLTAYDVNSPLRLEAQSSDAFSSSALPGDIQISGPGTLEVLAGRNLDLGVGPDSTDGTGVGISSIGNDRNPALPFGGADIVAMAGIGSSAGLDASNLNFTNASHTGFTDLFLNPSTGGAQALQYLPDLAVLMGLPSSDTTQQIWNAFSQLPSEQQDDLALNTFYLVLRDAGVAHTSSGGNYSSGYAAIAALAPGTQWQGDISLTSREIKTTNGGNISLFAPGGQLDVGLNVAGTQAVDQGILTEDGGNISIFTDGSVNVGTSRIFTLNGGDEIIWSTNGDIAAGNSSKTIQSAPPTRVVVDPQSGAIETDLAGLATGGGIGTLETRGKNPSNVYLIAPRGTINAGDAGIRSSGNLILAAKFVNPGGGGFSANGTTSGAPTAPAAPNIAGLTGAANATGAAANEANQMSNQARNQLPQMNENNLPSIITVDVIGYGGNDTD